MHCRLDRPCSAERGNHTPPTRCAEQLQIRYINLADRAERAAHMRAHLQAVLRHDRQRAVHGTPKRVEALRPRCPAAADAPCVISQPLDMLSDHELSQAASRLGHWSPQRRAGVMGLFLTALNELRHFAAHAHSPTFMLLLEDDVKLAPAFLSELPCLLAALPADAPWHVVRFGTWGSHYPEDEVRPTTALSAAAGATSIFRARAFGRKYGANGSRFAYGGTQAVLVQRSTVGELARHLARRGVNAFDERLREVPGGPIVSYAIRTPLVSTRSDLLSDIPKNAKGAAASGGPTDAPPVQVLSFTMVADEQPIICDGFSSTGDAVVSGNPSSNIETEGGSDAGAAVGVTFAVIVARHVGSAPAFNWCHSAPLPNSGRLDATGLGPV